MIVALQAEEIVYDRTDLSILKADPTELHSPHSSLLPHSSDITNTVTIQGPVSGQRTLWESSVAPYNVYGFASIQTEVGLGRENNGIDGASTKDSVVTIKDVKYDWSGVENPL